MAWEILETRSDCVVLSEDLAIADSAGANVVTVSTSTIPEWLDLNNAKFTVQVTVTETSAGDGAYDVKVQGAPNEDDWADVDASLGMDVDPTGTNTGTGLADTTNAYAAYWRLQVFTDGTDTVDAAAATIYVAVPTN